MMNTENIKKVAEKTPLEKDFIVVDVEVNSKNQVTVFLDSLEGINITDCIQVSRFIESHFDRETEDYEMNVSSAGIDRPLKEPLQYIKNIGRKAEVQLSDGTSLTGILTGYSEGVITLLCEIKEKDPLTGKNKKGSSEIEINLSNIKTIKIVVSFK
jgi:ribosome maturation factor RimP